MSMYYRRRKSDGTFTLQVTSMVDMFTIILVFLLKSYSTSAVQVTPADGLNLPMAQTHEKPVEGLKVALSPKSVLVEDQQVIDTAELSSKNKKLAYKKLFEKLQQEANKTKALAKINNTVKFDGRIVFQVDKEVPYSMVKKVMASASLAGYRDFRLVTLAEK